MVLSDLGVDFSGGADAQKQKLEKELEKILPAGSYMVILRSYNYGDARTANRKIMQRYQPVISLRRAGREAALAQKESLEKLGLTVTPAGEIMVNDN